MNRARAILVAATWLVVSGVASADFIRKTDGRQASGDVVEMSKLEVTVAVGGSRTQVPVNEIDSIRYSGEPSLLNPARIAVKAGQYEQAVEALEKIDLTTVQRAEIRQDIQFYTALAKARIALAADDDDQIPEAGRLMLTFVRDGSNNYHYLEACEVVGDLLVAIGEYAKAQEYYSQLEQAPWPDYKMRAAVAVGQAVLAEGRALSADAKSGLVEEKLDTALKSFEDALAIQAQGPSANRQRLAATLGKARCQAEKAGMLPDGKKDEKAKLVDEAVKLVEDVIVNANPEENQLLAQAYNTLGLAHLKAGRTKDALLAFLHVDILYFTSPSEHIEALENLVPLWKQVQQPRRAEEAAKILGERYKRSPRSE
jgi:tetratricopeptide (TPR) repeat protein